jgi:disulfide bond formation protein DsbB
MDTATFSLFYALLSVVALAGAAVVAVLHAVRRAPRWDGARRDLGRAALPLAWLVATVTTAGSLYYSKVVGYTPCELCWYQRIAVYPLVVVLGIAAVRRDRAVRPYVVAVCAIGAVIAAYHSWIQAFPPDTGTSFCTDDAPCTARHVWELGFVSLPFMAPCAFLSIISLMVASAWAPAPADDPHPTEAAR